MATPKQVAPSRRRVLNAAALGAPLFVGGGAMQLLAACAKTERVSDANMLELGAQSAVEHIRKGDMKAEAYAAQLLKQYDAHKDLNAVVWIDQNKVLEGARAVDQARARGDKLGVASGLLFAVKDQIAVAGYPATGGSAPLKGYIPKENAPVVDAVVKAGGIVFAKTNLPDMVGGTGNLAASAATFNPYYGAVHNPYDPSRSPGGSSGGNGAAIAARMVPAAIGEDTGGSVRFPASFCGIAGLRPSTYTVEHALKGTARKRYSDAGIIIPPAGSRDTFGPMARSVADLAFLDAIITGETTPPVNLRDMRIAIPRPDYWQQEFVDMGVASVIQAAFEKLRDAGAQLVEIDFEAVRGIADEQLDRALRMPNAQGKHLALWLQENLPAVTVEEVTKGSTPGGGASQGAELSPEERTQILEAAARSYADVFQSNGVVAIAFPTIPIPAPPIKPDGEKMGQTTMVNGKALDQTAIIIKNIFWGPSLGAPGLSLPAGLTRGLPVGLEFEGLPGDDTKLLGLGIAVENVLGRIPPPKFQQQQL